MSGFNAGPRSGAGLMPTIVVDSIRLRTPNSQSLLVLRCGRTTYNQSSFGRTALLLRHAWRTGHITSFPEHRSLWRCMLRTPNHLFFERTCHAYRYSKMVQRAERFRIHRARVRGGRRLRSHQFRRTCGPAGSRRGSYEIVVDTRNGKSSADQLQIAA